MMRNNMNTWLFLLVLSTMALSMTTAYSTAAARSPFGMSTVSPPMMGSTITAPPDTDIDKKVGNDDDDQQQETFDEFEIRKQGPLEYLEDDPNEMRDMKDPFHILLLGETFLKPKLSVNYVSGALQFVLDMPYEDAVDATVFCKEQGISCVGTWSREECLTLGKELQNRDLAIRVVPFVPGGQRGWQANKDADAGSSNGGEASDGGGPGGDYIDADYSYE